MHNGLRMMISLPIHFAECAGCELHLHSPCREGHDETFPCRNADHVDMDALSEWLRARYLYARVAIGRECVTPAVSSRPEVPACGRPKAMADQPAADAATTDPEVSPAAAALPVDVQQPSDADDMRRAKRRGWTAAPQGGRAIS
jgi:hypothetical protein